MLPCSLSAQKLPKGIDKALAAQEKARKATEKVDYAKGKRKIPVASSAEFSNYGTIKSPKHSSNQDILRMINERINEPLRQQKSGKEIKHRKIPDFEFGSPKKVLADKPKNH